jgi:heme exporter protein A
MGVRIAFVDVAKRYDSRVVFRGLSGEARPGEVLIIAGPNGSGKSTLVAILGGLVRPSKGRVTYHGDDAELPREQWRRSLGVVAPAIGLYEELSGLENLSFLARLRGVDRPAERCCHCLEEVGLDPRRTTPLRGYSTGMTQRLKIAQAMLHNPPVLLLDEPGSNLDADGQDWLEGFVARAAAGGKTVVLATNDVRELGWGGHRVALPG